MNVFKRYGWITGMLVLIGVLIAFIPWQHTIQKTYYGIQSRIGDAGHAQPVTVTVAGVYRRQPIGLRADTFEGAIQISGYDGTAGDAAVSLRFTGGYAPLVYAGVAHDAQGQQVIPTLYTLGMIRFSCDLERILVCVSEPIDASAKSWQAENGLFIALPAGDRAQALTLAQELAQDMDIQWLAPAQWR